jgi:GNAT superfamily N-acetyltransferase
VSPHGCHAIPDADDLACVRRLETAARHSWPAATERAVAGGWILRATPGLARGRSNHALTPCRPLARRELPGAISAVEAFSAEHGLRPGIQVSPIALHEGLESELDGRGWSRPQATLVLAGPCRVVSSRPDPELVITDHADPIWLSTWERCEPGRDVAAHATTVFAALRGRAHFARLGLDAVVIGVPWAGATGTFCLAVDRAHRRRGLARALMAALLSRAGDDELIYAQVEAANVAALALFQRFGLGEVYRYRHRVAPVADSDPAVSACRA